MGSLERFVICCLCRANMRTPKHGVLSDKSDMVFSSAMFRRGFFPLLLLLFVYCSSASEVVTVDVVKAKALLTSGHKYLDVRTVEEFKKGHVGSEKILNIPYMFDTPEGRVKNPQFLAEVSAACDKEDHLIVGCQSGVRSLYATVDLLSAGFKDVRNMGGFIPSLPLLSLLAQEAQSSMASLLNTVSSISLSSTKAIRLRNRPVLAPRSVSFTGRRFTIRATETDANEVKSQAPDKAPAAGGSSFNQLLGIKGAAQETNKWKIRLQLTKPVTWPPLVWGVVCGAAASGNFHWNLEDVAKSVACMLMSGPFLTGYTQTLNDWYDREIDAINEPYRPIPSGAISENEVITQIWVLLLGGLSLAGLLDVWAGHDFPIVFYLAIGGSLLSYIYSAPPLKLKQNGWIGNFALGASYISLPWWAGQALFGTLTPDIIVLTLLYSIAGLGIAIVNDFKSIEGDRALGLQSLPVAFGAETAKWICVGAIDITQISVAGYLLGAGKPYYALALLALIAPQVFFQFQYFLKDPAKYDVKYQASAQPFLVLGLLVTALATSH